MEGARKIIIGTRGSKLALVQTELVAAALKRADPLLEIETKIITTKGDVNQSPIPLDTVGKAWFTEEIEQAILRGEIDIAVHSLKDVPPELPAGLSIVPVLERGDAADVLVSKSGSLLKDLPRGAVIGTDSVRRKAFLLALRPDLVVKSIRGNVDTRLKKLETESEGYDAIVIAAAGLARLGLEGRVTERFDPTSFIPAPGQAILAIEVKQERAELLAALGGIVHAPTAAAAEIEQAFSNAIGGGCKLPIGCYAHIEHAKDMKVAMVTIYAGVGNMDGSRMVQKIKRGPLAEGKDLAQALAEAFLHDTADGKRIFA